MRAVNISDWDANMNDMLRGRNEHELYDMGYIDALDQVDDWMDAQPTLTLDDLRPKGRWIGIGYEGYADGTPVYDYWECSECGEEVEGEDVPETHPFCPNCGADMRGGGEDG